MAEDGSVAARRVVARREAAALAEALWEEETDQDIRKHSR